MKQNRRAPRKECLAKIKASWRGEERQTSTWGEMVDKSATGLGIRLPDPVQVGAIIAIAQGFSTQFGEVRHCSKMKGGFFVGIELCAVEEESPASQAGAQPIVQEKLDEESPAAAAKPDPGTIARSGFGMSQPPRRT